MGHLLQEESSTRYFDIARSFWKRGGTFCPTPLLLNFSGWCCDRVLLHGRALHVLRALPHTR